MVPQINQGTQNGEAHQMSRCIWKFPLAVIGRLEILMPRGAKILTVQTQNDRPCIWADIETDDGPKEARVFWTIGTGNLTPHNFDKMTYIGTYLIERDQLVFHLYEETV